MNTTTLACQSERRRNKIREQKDRFNGLDYVELLDGKTLRVFFLNKAPAEPLQPSNVVIKGGRRVRDIKVVSVQMCRQTDPERDDCMVVAVDKTGDSSTYTLCLVTAEKLLFGIPPNSAGELDACLEPASPRSHFEREGRGLAQSVRLKSVQPGSKWTIDDGDRSYDIRREDKTLNVYATEEPYPGFDPRYACLDFTFSVLCPSDLDCAQPQSCPALAYPPPEINYLAKDYASFRQLILDRLAVTLPDWQERHVPDLGIALVELLAYAGDYLSYYQDAVATEAYLETARQRISVRRHARLVDYRLHEGCNARAWVHVKTSEDIALDPNTISFITACGKAATADGRVLTWDDLKDVPGDRYEVFEPVAGQGETLYLYEAHNTIRFYTWGDRECCLPRGATAATLMDEWLEGATAQSNQSAQQAVTQQTPQKTSPPPQPTERQRTLRNLKIGDVLIFEEVYGPHTGLAADADPAHRHAVRLTQVRFAVDQLYDQPVAEIEWAEADALPFPLCISAVGPAPECKLIEDISVARGNIVLVDHGRRIKDMPLGCVQVSETKTACEGEGRPSLTTIVPAPFRPEKLEGTPITFYQPWSSDQPASKMSVQDPRQALPWINLTSVFDPQCNPARANGAASNDHWTAQADLLNSEPQDCHFVAEIDNEGKAHLRFGDGELGRLPEAGMAFTATYRVGNGLAGNVGAKTITQIVSTELLSGVMLEPRNPLPACGGLDPEPLAHAKLFAPYAFRRCLERAITADDYAEIVMRDFADKVQRAAATLRWTGSWQEVLVVIDQKGRTEADPALLEEIRQHLRAYRRTGHDLVVAAAETVPLDIELHVCVSPAYLPGHVKADLIAVFSNRTLPDGRLGVFHPDNLTFGEGVYLSKLVAAARAVPGVADVTVTKLNRLGEAANGEIAQGVLPLGPLEIARVDNDPSLPENGRISFAMGGGR
jgi:hypothetical protein